MIQIKVVFADGNSLVTGINATLEGAKAYYVGKFFNLGTDEDRMVKAVAVEEITG